MGSGDGFEELLVQVAARFVDASAASIDESVVFALETAARVHDIDRVHVWLADPATGLYRVTHRWSRFTQLTQYESRAISAAEFPWGAEILRRSDILAYRRAELPAAASQERAAMEAIGIHALAVIPLRVAGVMLGVVSFEHVAEDRPWTPMVLARFGLVASMVASALHHQQLYTAAAEVARCDRLVADVSSSLVPTGAEGMGEAIERALAHIGNTIDVDRVFLYEWNREATEARVRTSWSKDGEPPVREPVRAIDLRRYPYSRSRDPEPFVVERLADLPPEAEPERELLELAGARSLISVSVRSGGTTLGTLGLDTRHRERTWSPELVARAKTLGEVLANAIARERAELARNAAHAEVERLQHALERERDYLRDEIRVAHHVDELVAASGELIEVLANVDAVATTNATVLIQGETGVGKEIVARALHARSRRSTAPLVKIDCASLPRELFEREFFGHTAGAWPGIEGERVGRFELADRGTLLLDEVGEIPLELQSKLLRLLSDGEIVRLGDSTPRKLDVRVVATTNRSLAREVTAGRFRADLYHRLGAFPITVPPLRARPADIVPLATSFLRRAQTSLGRSDLALETSDQRTLLGYDWPGNVRELEQLMERSVMLSRAAPLRLDLAFGPRFGRTPADVGHEMIRTDTELRALERSNLRLALEKAEYRVGGTGGAAALLGISPSTLRDRMRAFGIEKRPETRRRSS